MYENLIWKNILTKFTEKHEKKNKIKKYCSTYSRIDVVIDDAEFNIVLDVQLNIVLT